MSNSLNDYSPYLAEERNQNLTCYVRKAGKKIGNDILQVQNLAEEVDRIQFVGIGSIGALAQKLHPPN